MNYDQSDSKRQFLAGPRAQWIVALTLHRTSSKGIKGIFLKVSQAAPIQSVVAHCAYKSPQRIYGNSLVVQN